MPWRAAVWAIASGVSLAGCSLPSLEDPPTTALSRPPAANLEVAQPPAPMVPATPTPAETQAAIAQPQELAQTTSSAPPPEPSPTVNDDQIEGKQPPPDSPESSQTESVPVEPVASEFEEGGIDAVYTSYGVEVSLGDGNMCVGDMPGTSKKLKSGTVLSIACSDDRVGQVKINRLIDARRADASLKLGAAGARKILVMIEE